MADKRDNAASKEEGHQALKSAAMVSAKQIQFFGQVVGTTSDYDNGSPMAATQAQKEAAGSTARDLNKTTTTLEPFVALNDDTRSLGGDDDLMDCTAIIDEEEEERAVAEFVSEIQLQNSSVKLRGGAGSKEVDEVTAGVTGEEDDGNKKASAVAEGEEEIISEQFSIDDVTDDEEGDACQDEHDVLSETGVEADGHDGRQTSQSFRDSQKEGGPPLNVSKKVDEKLQNELQKQLAKDGSSSGNRQRVSTKSDSATIRDSSSSN